MKCRNGAYDFIRVVGAVLIVFLHYQGLTTAKFDNWNFAHGTFFFGNVVELFFILSGILGMESLVDHGIEQGFKAYLKQRYCRLMPLVLLSSITYLGVVQFYYIATGTLWEKIVIYPGDMLLNILGIQEWLTSRSFVNPPCWYISVLLLCEIVLFLFLKLSKKYRINLNLLAFAMIILGIMIRTFAPNLPFMQGNYLFRGYIAFFTGVILYRLYSSAWFTKNKTFLAICSLIGIVLTFYFYHYFVMVNLKAQEYAFDDYYWIIFAFYPSILTLAQCDVVKRLFSNRLVMVLGKSSYEVYLWQYQFICLFMALNIALKWYINFNNPFYMVAFTLVLELFSLFMYFVLERWIHRIGSKFYASVISFIV